MVLESEIPKEKPYPKGIILVGRLSGRIQSDAERSRMKPSVLPALKRELGLAKNTWEWVVIEFKEKQLCVNALVGERGRKENSNLFTIPSGIALDGNYFLFWSYACFFSLSLSVSKDLHYLAGKLLHTWVGYIFHPANFLKDFLVKPGSPGLCPQLYIPAVFQYCYK